MAKQFTTRLALAEILSEITGKTTERLGKLSYEQMVAMAGRLLMAENDVYADLIDEFGYGQGVGSARDVSELCFASLVELWIEEAAAATEAEVASWAPATTSAKANIVEKAKLADFVASDFFSAPVVEPAATYEVNPVAMISELVAEGGLTKDAIRAKVVEAIPGINRKYLSNLMHRITNPARKTFKRIAAIREDGTLYFPE